MSPGAIAFTLSGRLAPLPAGNQADSNAQYLETIVQGLRLQLTQINMRRRKHELGVLLAALVVTAAILSIAVPALERTVARSYNVNFADGYDLIANNLAQGNGYRWTANMSGTMMREPGYPLFLAVIFKVFGYHIEAARWANWALTIGIAFMIMRLTRMVTADSRAPLIASLIFLFYPGTLIAEARAGVEIFFIFVAFVFLLLLQYALEKGNMWRFLVAGLGMGVVLQVRSTPLLFPLLLLFYLVLVAKGARELRRVVLNVAIFLLGTVIVIAPWVVRNYSLVHAFVPFSTLRGAALEDGQYSCRNLSFSNEFYQVLRESGRDRGELATRLGLRFEGAQYFQVFYDAHDELALNNVLTQSAKDTYIKSPGLLAGCIGKNLFNFWFLGRTWKVTELNVLIQLPLLVLALGGLQQLRKRGGLHQVSLMLMFTLSILAVHLPIVAEARYSIPVFAFLAIPASISIMSIRYKYGHIRKRRSHDDSYTGGDASLPIQTGAL